MDDPLYRRLLGEEFEKLDPALRDFHGRPRGGEGSGIVSVRCGPGFHHRLLARALGLPRPGEHVRVALAVTVDGGGEIWTRSFDGTTLRTIQWAEEGLLAERAGSATFRFRLACDAGGMRFHHHDTTILGMRLPRTIAPSISATITAAERGWNLEVILRVPVIGELLSYRGYIVPTS